MNAKRFNCRISRLPFTNLEWGSLTTAILPVTLQLILGGVLASTGFAGARIEIEKTVWDFGTVTNPAELRHDFTIRNAGDADLEIGRVVSSCESCLRTSLEKSRIPPGESGVLHCRLDLHTFNGPISRTASLYCNDAQHDTVLLELGGVVVPVYDLTPTEIVLDLSHGPQSAVMEIAPLVKLHAPLSQVICDNTNIMARLTQMGPDRFGLSVSAADSLPLGRAVINLTAKSADTNDFPCVISGFVHKPPEFEVLPAQMLLKPQSEPQMRILWLKQYGRAPLTLLDVVPPSDKFRCEIDPDPVSNNYKVYVTASQQQSAAGRTNMLILKMRDGSKQEQEVAVPILVEQQ